MDDLEGENGRVFDNELLTVGAHVARCKDEARMWVYAGARHLSQLWNFEPAPGEAP